MMFRSATLFALSCATTFAQFTLDILHVNDHHSHLAQETFEIDAASLPEGVVLPAEAEAVAVTYGGFPRLVSYIQQVQNASTADALIKLHAGDAITGTLYYSLYKGEADAEMMNYVCFDAFTLGNHEFDDGDASLATFIGYLQNIENTTCETPTSVLSANLQPGADSPLQGLVAPYTIYEVGEEQVGIISITTSITMTSSSPDEGTVVTDERTSAEEAVAELTGMGVNKIILLTHIGYTDGLSTDDFDLAAIDGVDIIVGGHSHSLLADPTEVAMLGDVDGPYPTAQVRETDNGQVCIVQAWEYGHGIGVLSVEFDDTGVVTSCTGSPRFPFDASTYEPVLDADSTSSLTAYLESLNVFVAVDPHPETAAALEVYLAGVEDFGNVTLATVPEPGICYERVPGDGRSQICTSEQTIAQGGGACNLVAQAFLDQVPSADIAIQNAGGCRTDIFPGDFKVVDAVNMLPFANTMVTLEVTGAEIELVLNQAINASALSGISTGAYPYAAGIRFDVDVTQGYPNFVSNLEVNIKLASDTWEPIDPEATYTVVTNSFIATGQDNYLTFGEISEDLVTDQFLEYSQVFIEYATKMQVLEDPPLETYSTQSFIGANMTDGEDESPVDAPVEAPTSAETETPGATQVPASSPVEMPAETPVESPVASPVAAPTSSSISLSSGLLISILVGAVAWGSM
ncbi:hypothetical protein FisN_26Hh177 [Fistulifera solaris]|uniref:5'-nucleotidase n=1 Tax=Fistulifera solaris TaxID=1519565 RepID=A0A1Z5JXW7_FISSO|nr:hypothetical protein FisN_26Hh177 [Fistulifera solaris]|eukprot:GAX18875.1 hypothetical protein FisN_26Hh177 [Fistulifera solaris]